MINLRIVSIAVAVCIGMLGAILLANPADLGISLVASRWLGIIAVGLGIIAVGLGILQGFLPRVTGPTTDPETLADRVWSLPDADRKLVALELAQRAEREKRLAMEAQRA